MNQKQLHHLYLRAGFGIDAIQQKDFTTLSKNEIISTLFSNSISATPLQVDLSEIKALKKSYTKNGKQKISKVDMMTLRKKTRQKSRELNFAWIDRLTTTDEILREKMTLFWANVFVCKDNNVWHIQQYNNTLRKYALGNFGHFVKAIAKEPSMNKYLNNKQNIKEHPNENFARELMELFTLGMGNYTEQDIKESARAFTGWSFKKDGSFFLKRKKHDFEQKTFMGKTGDFDGDDIIDIILEQKQCARFICTKVYRYFVNPQVDENHLEEITALFYKDYDIKKLMYHIFSADWFYADKNIGAKIKSPIELLVGIQKTVPIEYLKKKQLLYVQKMMGQELLSPPNVAGWKGDKSWIDSNTLMFRLKLPSLLLNNAEINLVAKGEFEDDFEMYYKQRKKKRQFFKTTIDWNHFNKKYDKVSTNKFKQSLIIATIDKDTATFLSTLAIENKKDYCIQLMSLPEYQMC